MKRLVLATVALGLFAAHSYAAPVLFELDTPLDNPPFPTSTNLSGNVFTSSWVGLADNGVTFDVTLTVTGSDVLNQTSYGMGAGILGSVPDERLNPGDYLRFEMDVSSVSGGAVTFDGFTAMDFSNFNSPPNVNPPRIDSAVLSTDTDPANAFFVFPESSNEVDISSVSPTTFYLVVTDNNGDGFRLDDVTALFTGTPVPEPTSLMLLGLGGLVLARRRPMIR